MGRNVVLLGLELGVLVANVLVQTLDKEVVDLLSESNLGHLQLSQIRDEHRVLEVREYHSLKSLHIFCSELGQAVIDAASHLIVLGLLSLYNSLDVLLTFGEVLDQFAQVLPHQFLVGENPLVLVSLIQLLNCDGFALL